MSGAENTPEPTERDPGDTAADPGDLATGPGVRRVHEFGNRSYIVADVEPLDVTGVRTVGVGGLLFFIAAVLMLPFYGWLADNDQLWRFWTCVVGAGLGLYGWNYCRIRERDGTSPRDTSD